VTVALILLAVAIGYRFRGHEVSRVGERPIVGFSRTNVTQLAPPIVGATYMGRHWPKNFINAFRREDVAADFAGLRADGFNAVVLMVSWGDFQPVFDPCCRYDERAFERLVFLIERARDAGLDVVLRIGYVWTFHPEAGDVGVRTHQLLNDARVRDAFFAYVARIGEIVRQYSNVRMSLLSWEDLWLHTIDPQAKGEFHRFLDTLPADSPWRSYASDERKLPTPDGPDAQLFQAYWDWLLMQDVFVPTAERLPELTYEARIDREPLPQVDAVGKTTYTWIGHEVTYHPPGADVTTLYWAPFWGARNEGEQLDSDEALHLLGALLEDVRQHSGALPIFIDQFNVVDNTLGFERNATLKPSSLPDFMDRALCTLRTAGVFGYAYWTTQDYAENPIYNPGFSYGLDGWSLVTAENGPTQQRLLKRPSGDFDLLMLPEDRLSQSIPARRGRLPGSDARLTTQVCLTAATSEPSVVEVTAGAVPVQLEFSRSEVARRVCSAISTQPKDANLELTVRGVIGAVDLSGVMLFDHVQEGGLYHLDGSQGEVLPLLRRLNRRFGLQTGADGCQHGSTVSTAH